MANPNRNNESPIARTMQKIQNWSFDAVFKVLAFIGLEFDGSALKRKQSDLVAQKITESGSFTYIAVAPAGTSQSSASWQVKCIEVSGSDTIITWADGNTDFDNVATDLTSLSYS